MTSFTDSQLALLIDSQEILSETLADVIQTASTLEWNAALNAVLLHHLIKNPTPEVAAEVRKTYSVMIKRLMEYATDGGGDVQ